MENNDYYVGIDYGTSNSCIGIFNKTTVFIPPNRIGERITPSIVAFSDDIYIGEESLVQKIEEKNLIYDTKRFIGLNYSEFEDSEFSKHLGYEVVNQNNKPMIKVLINGEEKYYSAEDICTFIIKRIVKNAEDFINVKITEAVITVPVHFSKKQRQALELAANSAGVKIIRIINEPTAAALAYGLENDLISQIEEKKNKSISLSELSFSNNQEVAPPPVEEYEKEKHLIVFDLGGGTFDITFLNICKNNDDLNFEVITTNGEPLLGGSDFDQKLIDYCIKRFCEYNEINEQIIKKDKKLCKRLKIKCEMAKKILSESNEADINIDKFYNQEDLSCRITQEKFAELCNDLLKKIEQKINELLEDSKKNPEDILAVILVGGATRMKCIKDLLKKKFGEKKIKDNINPDEAVAIGATLECSKIGKKDKINFTLQDIIPYNLGIAILNENMNDIKKGDLMYTIIKKYTKIPTTSKEHSFKVELSEKYPDININIYEGNKKYVLENTKLDVIKIPNLNKKGKIEYTIKFDIDVDSKLTVTVDIKSLKITKKFTNIGKVTNAFMDENTKKIKIVKNKLISPISLILSHINFIKESLSKSKNFNDKIKNLIDCSTEYEELINNYMIIAKDNDYILEKVYLYTKELFHTYLERIKLKDIKKDNINEIINKIKNKMSSLISVIGYISGSMDIFLPLRETFKTEFYLIFLNFLILMNNEGLNRMKITKFRRYNSKLYFEKAFIYYQKYVIKNDVLAIDRVIKQQLEEQEKLNKQNLDEINSFAFVIDYLVEEKKFLYANSGFTLMFLKLNKIKDIDNLTVEEIQELLDLFKNISDCYDKDKKDIGEAYCIANIIKIIYKILKIKNDDKLEDYIDRFNNIMEGREEENYEWLKEIRQIIKEIEENNQ